MNLIYLIKTLNLVALFLIPLNSVYAVFGYNNSSSLIYLWLCIIGFLINYYSKKKSKLIFLAIVVSFLPLITASSIEELIYLAVYCIITILVILRGRSVIRYDIELDMFKKGIYICIGTFIVSTAIGGIGLFSNYSAYYVIIYLVTSILLLRNLRFIEYNKDSSEGKRINNSYSIIIVIFSFILSISYVREMVIKIIKGSYLFIINLFMYLFSWLITGIAYVMSIVVYAIIEFLNKLGPNPQKLEIILQPSEAEAAKMEQGEVFVDKLLNNPIYNIIVRAFIILIVVYIIMRLFKGFMNNVSEQEEYSEEKELILRKAETDKSVKKVFLDFLKPKSYNEQIRLYYQKYMSKCLDRDIEITEMDTTEEINNKSQIKFDKKLIDDIRNIYIKIRYGEKESTKEMAKEMGQYVKSIRKH